MSPTTGTTGAISTSAKPKRGKDQLSWSAEVWDAIDQAVVDESARSRVCSKFLPQVYVHKKRVNVDSDLVILPSPGSGNFALSVDETNTTKIQEYSFQHFMTPAQIEAEGKEDAELAYPIATAPPQSSPAAGHSMISRSHRASTAVSLSQRGANLLAQAEDLVVLGGQNAIKWSPLFVSQLVQPLDSSLSTTLDSGLLNISAKGDVNLPNSFQIIPVHPTVLSTGGRAPFYRENTLNAIASGVGILQGLGHYEGYAVVMHTAPYIDLFQALPTTLIQPVEPVMSLIRSGIYGTGALPPFIPVTPNAKPGSPPVAGVTVPGSGHGLPSTIAGSAISFAPDPTLFAAKAPAQAAVLYTAVIVSLTGNTMDLVRAQMDDGLDVSVTFTQKSANEQHLFRGAQRHAVRVKDPTAIVVLLFVDC